MNNNSTPLVHLSSEVLEFFETQRQKGARSRETGGQLFAELTAEAWFVRTATAATPMAKRLRRLFLPDRRAEQAEIQKMFSQGLHYVGDWHTHPEPTASPSAQDLDSIADTVRKSQHELEGFLLLILGTRPGDLWASLHRNDDTWQRIPVALSGMK